MNKRSAFSLIELMVVIAIIGILAVMGIANFQSAVIKSRDAKRVSALNNLQQALVMYRSDKGTYPTSDTITHDPNSTSGIVASGGGFDSTFVGNDKYIRELPNPPIQGNIYQYTASLCPSSTTRYCSFTLCTELENDNDTAGNANSHTGGACSGPCTHYCVYSP